MYTGSKWECVIKFAAACFICVTPPLLEAADISKTAKTQPGGTDIILLRLVRADFFAPNFPEDQAELLVEASLPRYVPPLPNEKSISDVMRRAFKITESHTPVLYQKVLNKILTDNGLETAEHWRGNALVMPDLPKTTKPEPSPSNPFYEHPRVSTALGGRLMQWDRAVGALRGVPKVDDNRRKAVRLELQTRTVPFEQAKQYAALAADAPAKKDLLDGYIAFNQPLIMQIAADSNACNPESMFENEAIKTKLAQAMKAKPTRRPVVVVLDDSWPDEQEYQRAVSFVSSGSDAIRDAYKLGARETAFPKKTSFDGVDPFPKCELHSSMIKAALKELSDFDSENNIDIIYLPLNRAQIGARTVLQELIYVTLLARSLGTGLGTAPFTGSRPKLDVQTPKELAENVVDGSSLEGKLNPYNGTTISVPSDKAVVEAVAYFLSLFSEATGRPHLLSLSWTVPNLVFEPVFRDDSLGVILAAAGNENKDVISEKLQFAVRSAKPGDVIAILNGTGNGPACNSNSLPVNVPVFGLAFPGGVRQGICGTSFSAPRAAWFLAAREALKGVEPPSTNAFTWWAKLKENLVKMQDSSLSDQRRFAVSPEKLLHLQ